MHSYFALIIFSAADGFCFRAIFWCYTESGGVYTHTTHIHTAGAWGIQIKGCIFGDMTAQISVFICSVFEEVSLSPHLPSLTDQCYFWLSSGADEESEASSRSRFLASLPTAELASLHHCLALGSFHTPDITNYDIVTIYYKLHVCDYILKNPHTFLCCWKCIIGEVWCEEHFKKKITVRETYDAPRLVKRSPSRQCHPQ